VYDTDQNLNLLDQVQREILTVLVRILEESDFNEDKVSQAFETINNIGRRCYLVTNKLIFFTNMFNQEYLECTMGESFFERLCKFVFNDNEVKNKSAMAKCLDVIETLTNNLFIKTPIESAQDVSEYQFGFVVDTIAGKKVEESKEQSSQNAEMKEDSKADKEKDQKKEDASESKVLEQQNNKKKSMLQDQINIFTKEQGVSYIEEIFMKYFSCF
jgi:hypothetical protein